MTSFLKSLILSWTWTTVTLAQQASVEPVKTTKIEPISVAVWQSKTKKSIAVPVQMDTIADNVKPQGELRSKRGQKRNPSPVHTEVREYGEVRVKLLTLSCYKADDKGNDEELYGRLWALNTRNYNSVQGARRAFQDQEILKMANNGIVWETDRNHYIIVPEKKYQPINREAIITYQKGDQIVLLGDLDERDFKNADDLLNGNGTVDYIVLDLMNLNPNAIHNLLFRSGGTRVSMQIKVELVP